MLWTKSIAKQLLEPQICMRMTFRRVKKLDMNFWSFVVLFYCFFVHADPKVILQRAGRILVIISQQFDANQHHQSLSKSLVNWNKKRQQIQGMNWSATLCRYQDTNSKIDSQLRNYHDGCPFRSSPSVWNHACRSYFHHPFGISATGMMKLSDAQMFGISGAGLSGVRALQNGGKRARHSIDAWDRVSIPTFLTCWGRNANHWCSKVTFTIIYLHYPHFLTSI